LAIIVTISGLILILVSAYLGILEKILFILSHLSGHPRQLPALIALVLVGLLVGCAIRNRSKLNNGLKKDQPAPFWLIICSLAIGFAFGLLENPVATRAVDGALVLSGLVNYPPESAMGQYFFGSWTLSHQLGAFLLHTGVKQEKVNLVISLVSPTLLVGAFAMTIYGFTQRPILALAAAPICFLVNPLADVFASPDYPLLGSFWDIADEHTYGAWAGVGAAWVFGSLAGGRNRLTGFSAALLVCIHPVIGAYVITILLILLFKPHFLIEPKRSEIFLGLALGGLVTSASFTAYVMMRPNISVAFDAVAFQTYMNHWDGHRLWPMTGLRATRVALSAILQVGAFYFFCKFAARYRHAASTALLALLISVIISTVTYFAFHLFPALVPEMLIRAIPGRFLNVHAYLGTAIAIGLAIWLWDLGACRLPHYLPRATAPLICALLLVLALPWQALSSNFVRVLQYEVYLQPPSDISFWLSLRQTGIKGMVLTSTDAARPALELGHLAPLLDPTAFNFVPYFPLTAKAVASALEFGYGIQFDTIESEVYQKKYDYITQAYWAQLTPNDWEIIANKLNFDAILAPSNWMLQLPILVAGPKFTMYKSNRPGTKF
jgi:hypothetical protein